MAATAFIQGRGGYLHQAEGFGCYFGVAFPLCPESGGRRGINNPTQYSRLSMCVCMCVCVCARARVCVCVVCVLRETRADKSALQGKAHLLLPCSQACEVQEPLYIGGWKGAFARSSSG